MKTNEIYKSIEEFKKFITSILGDCTEDYISIENIDIDNDEIKLRYEDSKSFPGIFITSYKRSGVWSDIKVHINPEVTNKYSLKKE